MIKMSRWIHKCTDEEVEEYTDGWMKDESMERMWFYGLSKVFHLFRKRKRKKIVVLIG